MEEGKDRENSINAIKIKRYSCPKGHEVPYRTWNTRVEAVEGLIDKEGNLMYELSLYCFMCNIRYRISQLEKI